MVEVSSDHATHSRRGAEVEAIPEKAAVEEVGVGEGGAALVAAVGAAVVAGALWFRIWGLGFRV
jgi:hypothetical protein